ncbi:hypothetical protein [Edaphobacter albus]|uniref:hypothetical protein n=1 Tax=Edaphobacter sp. 4G125 TaxID=2763071 RepID=UPI0016466EA4|nr:hypothetical protein [Edaphobacter sp. 4G125]QNI36156.1 hypothetical protein H7846_14345 [Edaphobacter sp. 4G125]
MAIAISPNLSMRKSVRYSLFAFAALIFVSAIVLALRKSIPPKAARLLPEADAIVYVNLKPLRLATNFDKTPVNRAPEYQQFIDATGIVPERDLDDAAFALHRMSNPNGPNGPVGYSEIFEGRFDSDRLARYLESIAISRENYADHTIYTITIHDGEITRPLRITQLSSNSLAASNMPTAEQIHSILDHSRSVSLFSGPTMLSALYRDVPMFASAWGVGRLGLPFSEAGSISVLGLQLPLSADNLFVASLRYAAAVQLRIEDIASSEAEAAQTAQKLSTLLGLFQSLQQMQTHNQEDTVLAQMVGSIKVEPHKERAVLTATIPLDLLQTFTRSATASQQDTTPATQPDLK